MELPRRWRRHLYCSNLDCSWKQLIQGILELGRFKSWLACHGFGNIKMNDLTTGMNTGIGTTCANDLAPPRMVSESSLEYCLELTLNRWAGCRVTLTLKAVKIGTVVSNDCPVAKELTSQSLVSIALFVLSSDIGKFSPYADRTRTESLPPSLQL
jgi:hypothetical protein